MDAILRLFKAVEINRKRSKKPTKRVLTEAIKRGFVFDPKVVYNFSEGELISLAKTLEHKIGLTPEQMNNAFHKSWVKISEASMSQLVMEQIIHYFTTYGLELFGAYSPNTVFIPFEELELPEIDVGRIPLVVIKGYTKKEIKAKLLDLLRSGIALKEETVNDVVEVAKHVKVTQDDIQNIKNREVKVSLCDHLNMFPEDPVEFLRYLVYKTTGRLLLIKNVATVELLKEGDLVASNKLIQKYRKNYGLQRLAEVFYRFKPLFLALREHPELRPVINKVRKLAVSYHKPMPEDYLNSVTGKIKSGKRITKKELTKHLKTVNTFRKVRLAYALNYRTRDVDSIMYKIRNGKAWATEFNFEKKEVARRVLGYVLDSIAEDISKHVKGKNIYIPSFVTYALPATEKQFTGYFPSGSYVVVPDDMVVGINWNNVSGYRVDLDLSVQNPMYGKIGWDASYRNQSRSILFSGDMTDASGKNGASELFYVKRQLDGDRQGYIMMVNYFNFSEQYPVPYKILIANRDSAKEEQFTEFNRNYMVDPSKVIALASSKIDVRQKILGLIVITNEENRFYFSECDIGKTITSRNNNYTHNSYEYLFNFYRNTFNFNDLLERAGANIITEPLNDVKIDIDLSPSNLEKDTIINLLS